MANLGNSSIGISRQAALLIQAAATARLNFISAGGHWPVETFADQLTRFLIAERLMPIHVAPADLRRAIEIYLNGDANTT